MSSTEVIICFCYGVSVFVMKLVLVFDPYVVWVVAVLVGDHGRRIVKSSFDSVGTGPSFFHSVYSSI